TEGVTKAARTCVRSSAYLPSKDSASSEVIFTACGISFWLRLGSLLLLRFHLGPAHTLSGCDSLAPCHGDRSLWFQRLLLLCPSRFLRQADLPTSSRAHAVPAPIRAIGARTTQSRKCRVNAMDFPLCSFALGSQLLHHDGQVSHL